MAAHRLHARPVERVWGRRDLPPGFPRPQTDGPIGEIWFEPTDDAELLVKYLFTSERLSIQVHPDDAAARARGYPRGKDEAWFVIDAEPGAVIGLGLTRQVSREQVRQAALDGSIENLLDWRPVAKGDLLYSPAGTVHAIGGGIALIEVQQNVDLTYRLYDYGRPRELHLDEAVAVATPGPWSPPSKPVFTLQRLTVPRALEDGSLIVPLRSGGAIDGEPLIAGSVWSVAGSGTLSGDIDALVARSSRAWS
jgi:mannose-6-phosphate isomerase